MITLEPPWTPAAQQRLYRLLLAAVSRPGTVVDLAADLDDGRAALGALAALADAATTLHDGHGLLAARERGLLGALPAAADTAQFVLADGRRTPDERLAPARGSLLAPERGATLVLDLDAVGEGPLALGLEGPGIAGTTTLALAGLDRAWLERRAAWCDLPLGVDVLLCDRHRLAALPRTTRIRIAGGT